MGNYYGKQKYYQPLASDIGDKPICIPIPEGGFDKKDKTPQSPTSSSLDIPPPAYSNALNTSPKNSGMLDNNTGHGGLISLVAKGPQDKYLTGNKQFTLFKQVPRRHTNFSMQTFEIPSTTPVKLGEKHIFNISRHGDLCYRMYLDIELPQLTSYMNHELKWTTSIGFAMIEYVELLIGGTSIDKHTGEWLKIWYELTTPLTKQEALDKMVGNLSSSERFTNRPINLIIPLQFFFNRFESQALPLIALQYHEVRINLKLRPLEQLLINSYNPSKIPAKIELDNEPQIRLYCDYVYLDTDERRSVAQMSHEYLVPLLQHQEFIIDPNDPFQAELLINFNHPTKEIIFTVQRDEQAENRCCDFGNSNDELFSGVKLLFNGQCILGVNDTKYLRLLQNYEHHTNIPRENIYTYSFALNPEELQPSGTINFTRLDNNNNNKLKFEFSEKQKKNGKLKIKVFAPYYNVLRIMDGMGGLVFRK